MKYVNITRILATALFITISACSVAKNAEERAECDVMVVRIPPFHNPSLTPLQNFHAFHHFLHPVPGDSPIMEVKGDAGTWHDLPHDDTLLYLELSKTGEVSINSEPQSSLDAATNRLSGIFENRQEMGVYAPGTDRIVKAVGIRIPDSAKYPELIRIVKAAKESGADPVVLLLDGHLPHQILEK